MLILIKVYPLFPLLYIHTSSVKGYSTTVLPHHPTPCVTLQNPVVLLHHGSPVLICPVPLVTPPPPTLLVLLYHQYSTCITLLPCPACYSPIRYFVSVTVSPLFPLCYPAPYMTSPCPLYDLPLPCVGAYLQLPDHRRWRGVPWPSRL